MWTRVRGHIEAAVLAVRALTRPPLGLALALAVIMIPYVYFSLSLDASWPGAEPNAARWTEQGTLLLEGPGRAITPAPPPWLSWVKRTNRLQVDLKVRPLDARSSTIFTISDDIQARNLVIEQRREGVIVRLRSTCGGFVVAYRTCDAVIYERDVLPVGRWSEIRVRIEPGRLYLVVGDETASDDLGPLPLLLWNETYRLALGNEIIGNRGWLGEIARARVRTPGFVADYVDPAKLEIEGELRPLDRIKLVPFASFAADDVARNAIMYVPLGVALALLGLFPGRRGGLQGVVALALVSLTMETIQVFLPDRTPSVNDLILNTGGGAIGFLVARWILDRWLAIGRTESAGPCPPG